MVETKERAMDSNIEAMERLQKFCEKHSIRIVKDKIDTVLFNSSIIYMDSLRVLIVSDKATISDIKIAVESIMNLTKN